jgi:hypothetical protein
MNREMAVAWMLRGLEVRGRLPKGGGNFDAVTGPPCAIASGANSDLAEAYFTFSSALHVICTQVGNISLIE